MYENGVFSSWRLRFLTVNRLKIGLINIEPKIVNYAYLLIAGYYRSNGAIVEWYSPLYRKQYDKVFCSCLFDFTDKSQVPPEAVCGGTGFPELINVKLPSEIEGAQPDYSIYPKCTTSFLWFSRGCVHNCPYCVVPKKEGYIRSVEPKCLNPKGKTITVIDNNPFKNPNWEEMVKFLVKVNKPVNFCSGISLRDFNDLHGLALQKLKIHKQINVAWDNPLEDLRPKILQLLKFIKPYRVQCYVLVEYWSTKQQDLDRIYWLKEQGVDPFVMPYKKTRYAKDLARWCNKRIIKSCPDFEKYNRKEFEQLQSVETNEIKGGLPC